MEENWADALSGFVGVWQRVQGSGPEPASGKTEPEYETMKCFIRSEAAGQRLYSALARLTEGRCADTFAGMAAECGRGLKRLQTVCFLVTGDTVIPETEQLPADGLLGYLRRAYLREGEAARDYLRAAVSAEGEMLRSLYGELAGRCTGRREKLFGLADVILG